jgi:hypothetical protein
LEGCRDPRTRRLRYAVLPRGANRAGGVWICKSTAPAAWRWDSSGRGLKLTRQPPPGCKEITTCLEQPWQITATGTWQVYWPASAALEIETPQNVAKAANIALGFIGIVSLAILSTVEVEASAPGNGLGLRAGDIARLGPARSPLNLVCHGRARRPLHLSGSSSARWCRACETMAVAAQNLVPRTRLGDTAPVNYGLAG